MVLASLWGSVEIKFPFRLANVQLGDGRRHLAAEDAEKTRCNEVANVKMYSSFQQANAIPLFNQISDVLVFQGAF